MEMDLSQLLEDSPLRLGPKQSGNADLYNEKHRLALEELLSGGPDTFLDFLSRERIPNFLSQEEIRWIQSAAVPPRCASLHGEDLAPDQSLSSSADCSSATYFPEVSDVEPPLLEMGWPAFTTGSYRGVTRAVAHFQPSYGECIYGCKEAARRMIQNAKEVIAIVTDSLTDLDIFKDLQEACTLRRVPVYILLDQSGVTAFLQMCRNVGAHLDQLQQMRVRTIAGTTYYMRSGGRITGKAHERFMLIDGIKVATGSYRFNWTDGKLNSSNLIELTGQITEKFDEEFRVLYAQSLPINPRAPPSVRNSGVCEHLRHPLASSPHTARGRPAEAACLTSTPTRKPKSAAVLPPCEPLTPDRRKKNETQYCTMDENWEEHQLIQEEILAGSTSHHIPALQLAAEEPPNHASTQTSRSVTDGDVQTNCQLAHHPETVSAPTAAMSPSSAPLRKISPTEAPPESTLKDRLRDLTTERQRHYSSIRSKLEHMRAGLSARRELADAANMTDGLRARGRQRAHKDCGHEPNPRLLVDCGGRGT